MQSQLIHKIIDLFTRCCSISRHHKRRQNVPGCSRMMSIVRRQRVVCGRPSELELAPPPLRPGSRHVRERVLAAAPGQPASATVPRKWFQTTNCNQVLRIHNTRFLQKIWSPGSHLYERFILSTEAIVYVIPLNNTCIHRQSDAYLDKELHMLRNPYFCENEYSRSKNMHKETTETAATSQQSWPGSQS